MQRSLYANCIAESENYCLSEHVILTLPFSNPEHPTNIEGWFHANFGRDFLPSDFCGMPIMFEKRVVGNGVRSFPSKENPQVVCVLIKALEDPKVVKRMIKENFIQFRCTSESSGQYHVVVLVAGLHLNNMHLYCAPAIPHDQIRQMQKTKIRYFLQQRPTESMAIACSPTGTAVFVDHDQIGAAHTNLSFSIARDPKTGDVSVFMNAVFL